MSKDKKQKDVKDEKVETEVPETENAETEPVEEVKETELETARREAREYKDLALRRMAELENFRRNNQNLAKDVRDRTLSEVILQILPAIDSFNRAEEMVSDEKTKSGISIVKDQLMNVLKK